MAGAIRQFVKGAAENGVGATLGMAVIPGSVLVATCYERNGNGGQVSLNPTAPSPADGSWTTYEGPGIQGDNNNGDGMTLQAKTASTSFAGPWFTTAIGGGNIGELCVYEITGVVLAGAQHLSESKKTPSPANPGSFTCGAGDVVIMGIIAGQGSDPTYTPGIFTQDADALFHAGGVPWTWAGSLVVPVGGSVACSVAAGALAGGNARLGSVALRLLNGTPPLAVQAPGIIG